MKAGRSSSAQTSGEAGIWPWPSSAMRKEQLYVISASHKEQGQILVAFCFFILISSRSFSFPSLPCRRTSTPTGSSWNRCLTTQLEISKAQGIHAPTFDLCLSCQSLGVSTCSYPAGSSVLEFIFKPITILATLIFKEPIVLLFHFLSLILGKYS